MLGLADMQSHDLIYLLAAANIFEAIVECAHPPLVVCRIGRLLLAQPELVLLVGDEEWLFDASPFSIKRVAGALPSLLAQICLCVHRCEFVWWMLTGERPFFLSELFCGVVLAPE